MSRISAVLKNKRKMSREADRQRSETIRQARADSMYNLRLNEDLKAVDTLFEDPNIKEIHIDIREKDLSNFMRATFTERMSEYDITVNKNTAVIRRRIVNF